MKPLVLRGGRLVWGRKNPFLPTNRSPPKKARLAGIGMHRWTKPRFRMCFFWLAVNRSSQPTKLGKVSIRKTNQFFRFYVFNFWVNRWKRKIEVWKMMFVFKRVVCLFKSMLLVSHKTQNTLDRCNWWVVCV